MSKRPRTARQLAKAAAEAAARGESISDQDEMEAPEPLLELPMGECLLLQLPASHMTDMYAL